MSIKNVMSKMRSLDQKRQMQAPVACSAGTPYAKETRLLSQIDYDAVLRVMIDRNALWRH